MNILRITMICALLWCVGLQHAKAGDLLSKEDSLELVRLYQDYVAAKKQAVKKMISKRDQLDYSDSLYEKKKEEIEKLYEEELEGLKNDFGASLAANPRFAQVTRLRNLLMKYIDERKADRTIREKTEEWQRGEYIDPETGNMMDEKVAFIAEWDSKLIKLIKDNPAFMDYPEYLFKEIDEDMHVATSADGRLRYYSWHTSHFGTGPNVIAIRHYRTTNGKVLLSWEGGDDPLDSEYQDLVNKIHTLDVNGKRVYLLEEYNTQGAAWGIYRYHAEAIEKNVITHPTVFDTNDDKGDLVLYFNRGDWEFRHDYGEKESWVVKYDEPTRTIFVRKYKDDERSELSEDYITYTFDREKFVRSYQENVDYATQKIISYVEESAFYNDKNILLNQPYEILSGNINDKKYVLCDKSLVEDMKKRIERRDPIAHILYLGAAEKGDMVAQYKLGKCYYHGYLGVTKNTVEARKWFEKAAGQGHWLSQKQLGTYYNDQRYNNASSWYAENSAEIQGLTAEIKEFVANRDQARNGWNMTGKITANEEVNNAFQRKWEQKFIDFIRVHPKTLDYPDKEMEKLLDDNFHIETSPDGMLRTYYWSVYRGVSGFNNCKITQFRTADGKTHVTCSYEKSSVDNSEDEIFKYIHIKDLHKEHKDVYESINYETEQEWEMSPSTIKIYQMDTDNGRVYIQNGQLGVHYLSTSIITDDTIYLIPIFIKGNEKTSVISIAKAWYDSVTFDEADKTITIYPYEEAPEDGHYIKSKKGIVYKFDGQFFRKVE